MTKQHNLEPKERARNAGWQAGYHMVLTDLNWDDKQFKLKSIESIRKEAFMRDEEASLLELVVEYDDAKRRYLAQQQ